MKRKNKNISKTIKPGTILQTRDEFLEEGNGYKKANHKDNDYYRKFIVVDTNSKNELAGVKGTTKGTPIPGVNKTTVRSYVYTKNHKKEPIKIGRFFKKSKQKPLKKNQVNFIKKFLLRFSSKKRQKENRKKLHLFKNRK